MNLLVKEIHHNLEIDKNKVVNAITKAFDNKKFSKHDEKIIIVNFIKIVNLKMNVTEDPDRLLNNAKYIFLKMFEYNPELIFERELKLIDKINFFNIFSMIENDDLIEFSHEVRIKLSSFEKNIFEAIYKDKNIHIKEDRRQNSHGNSDKYDRREFELKRRIYPNATGGYNLIHMNQREMIDLEENLYELK